MMSLLLMLLAAAAVAISTDSYKHSILNYSPLLKQLRDLYGFVFKV